jgi:amino acid adenylation domain-containing protein
MLTDTQAPILLTQTHLTARFAKIKNLQAVCLDTDWVSIAQESEANPVTEITAANLAYVIYTSGSTGTPKGVTGLHLGAINRFNWMWKTYPFDPQEICCQKTTLSFVDSIWEIFGPLLQGIQTIIIPNEVLKDPSQLVQTLATHRVTRIVLVPSLLRVLLDSFDDLQKRLADLKIWVSSGEEISVELAQRFRQVMPEAKLINLYGSSEVSADVSCYEVAGGRQYRCIPIGRPIDNTSIYILDSHLQPVPIGVPGELYIGGVGLARGYLNQPDWTAERFIPSPFGQEEVLFKTGDLGRYLPDGNIDYLGRRDHQVKVRGFRIELAEIEIVLAQHASVREAVVLAIEDKPLDRLLVAYVVSDRDKVDKISELRNFLKQRLPDYMVPQAYAFLDALPLTPNGKVDRQVLSKHDFKWSKRESELVAPKTATEKFIVGIWKKLLGVNEIGIYDNFFELGGHSLLATRVISHVRDTFQVELPVHCFFDAPTVAGLTEILEIYETVPGRTSAIAQILEKIDAMDAQEVRKMLHDKKKGAVCDL